MLFLNNPLFHQIQNTVKFTFCLQSHTATTSALLTQVSIWAARFCQRNLFLGHMKNTVLAFIANFFEVFVIIAIITLMIEVRLVV